MIDEAIWVPEHGMEESPQSQLILSFRHVSASRATLTVGCFGQENVTEELYVGDFTKYANHLGLFEVRLTKIGSNYTSAQLRIRQISGPLSTPERSLDEENAPFTVEEIKQVRKSVSEIKTHFLGTTRLEEKQKAFMEEQFAHMEAASVRMGRKDWLVLAIGTLTNVVIGAALNPDSARILFQIAQRLLGWVFGGIRLLPE